ncbi:hypothetical protein ACP70R_012099 [Stipagrostis hirtigluma subsp. patula]
MVTFTARRGTAELVVPARRTPHGCKPLSDVDDQWEHRYYESMVLFFRTADCINFGRRRSDEPAKEIKRAVAEALVHYYPVAGRLQETTPGGKLVVDCTGDGILFVEANADVRLEELGQRPLAPPYPGLEELLCDVAGETAVNVIGRPLLYVQVTRLKCGGFALGFCMCRNIVDDTGMMQFIKAVADLAHGKDFPDPLPVWDREILTAQVPARITYMYPAHEPFMDLSDGATADDMMLCTPPESMVARYFLFGADEIASLRQGSQFRQRSTAFVLLAALMWRCRTAALGYRPDQRVRARLVLDARRHNGSGIPGGYYGNAVVCPIMEAGVEELCGHPLADTVALVQAAMASFDVAARHERMESMLRMMAALRGKPPLTMERVYVVSDLTHLGVDQLIPGCQGTWWFGGRRSVSHCVRASRGDDACGEEAIVVSMWLPRDIMDRFAEEVSASFNMGTQRKTLTPSCL